MTFVLIMCKNLWDLTPFEDGINLRHTEFDSRVLLGGDELKLNIPEYVKKVVNTLNKNGFEAFVVGGAVRDAMLGQNPDDWDVTTNAPAERTKECFDRHFDTGIKHGTITVLMDKKPVEVTTYRIDGEYKDNRRPETVAFTTDIKEDLKRRDFTINAMAYNDEVGLVDLYGGADDLKNKIIRCVGDADTRFGEDALRIMRAIRFAARLGFEIEEKTFCSIVKNRFLLENISVERIQSELVKMLETSDNLQLLFKSGVAEVIIPEVDYNKITLNTPSDREIKLSALLYNVADGRDFFNRLKFDNATKNNVLKIIECTRADMGTTDYEIKKLLNKYGEVLFEKALIVSGCYGRDMSLQKQVFDRVKSEPYSLKQLAVTGNDIMDLGIKGAEVGRVMNTLLDEVTKNPRLNTKEKLLDIAKSHNMC